MHHFSRQVIAVWRKSGSVPGEMMRQAPCKWYQALSVAKRSTTKLLRLRGLKWKWKDSCAGSMAGKELIRFSRQVSLTYGLSRSTRSTMATGGSHALSVTWPWPDLNGPHNVFIVCLRKFNVSARNITICLNRHRKVSST